jgi:hypothetical protein
MYRSILLVLGAACPFFGGSYAAPHHFNQCELMVQGYSMRENCPNGETFDVTYDPVESLETHYINFERDPLYITGNFHTVEEFSSTVGTLLHFSLFMGGPSTMNDGLKRYLSHRGIETNAFTLDTQEVRQKSAVLGQNFSQALFNTIYNAPQNVSLITSLQEQGLDPDALYTTHATFFLDHCPINTLGVQLTELTFYSRLHIKDSELSDTDSD